MLPSVKSFLTVTPISAKFTSFSMKKRTNSIINQQKQQQSFEVNRSKQNVNNVRSKKRTGDAISFEVSLHDLFTVDNEGSINAAMTFCACVQRNGNI